MKCSECAACRKGWFSSRPNNYVCTGVKEPFIIKDINQECTEYKDDYGIFCESRIISSIMDALQYRIKNAKKVFNELMRTEDAFEVFNNIKLMDEKLKSDVLFWAIEKIKFENKEGR